MLLPSRWTTPDIHGQLVRKWWSGTGSLSAQPKLSGGKPTWTADGTRDRGREAARQHELLFGLGQYCVDAGLIFCQAGTLGRVGQPLVLSLRLASGPLSPRQ